MSNIHRQIFLHYEILWGLDLSPKEGETCGEYIARANKLLVEFDWARLKKKRRKERALKRKPFQRARNNG